MACIAAVAASMVACDSTTGNDTPNEIAATGGDGQTVAVHATTSAPLSVKVTDTFGNPVHNAVVTWTVDTGDGTVAPLSAKTALDGTESANFTGGDTAGDNIVTATVGGIYQVHFTEHVGS